ncbi:MAG: TIGR03617 family F420-dependent LLM class oxidoreductase [Pseudomonadota bacterium]|nr:TIGR03617 family F420-dependent LLM class oxidoreductase [Pseudomonadota bacterium]
MKIDGGIESVDPRESGKAAKELEDAGYDGGFIPETSHDPFLPLVTAALATEKIDLYTSIAVAFARNPMTLANLSYDLHLLSKGRFILGLGSQIKPHITKRFSMPWSSPAKRMQELIEAIRAIWDCWQNDSKLDFKGEFYTHTLMTPMFSPGPNPFGLPKIYVAAVGPLMTKAVAESADGLLVHPFHTPKYMNDVTLPIVNEALSSKGKDRSDFDLTISVMTATGINEESYEKSINACKNGISFYASTPAYKGVLDAHGYGDLQGKLNLLSKEGKWKEMSALIDDELLNTVAVVAETPEAAAKEIKLRYGDQGDRINPAFYSNEKGLASKFFKALKSTS